MRLYYWNTRLNETIFESNDREDDDKDTSIDNVGQIIY